MLGGHGKARQTVIVCRDNNEDENGPYDKTNDKRDNEGYYPAPFNDNGDENGINNDGQGGERKIEMQMTTTWITLATSMMMIWKMTVLCEKHGGNSGVVITSVSIKTT